MKNVNKTVNLILNKISEFFAMLAEMFSSFVTKPSTTSTGDQTKSSQSSSNSQTDYLDKVPKYRHANLIEEERNADSADSPHKLF